MQPNIILFYIVNLRRLFHDVDTLKIMPLAVFPLRLRRSNSGTSLAHLHVLLSTENAGPPPVVTKAVTVKSFVNIKSAPPAAIICYASLPDDTVPSNTPEPDDTSLPDFMAIDLAEFRANQLAAPPIASASTSANDLFASSLTSPALGNRLSPLTGPLYEYPPLPMVFPPAPRAAISPEPFPPVASGSGSHAALDPGLPMSNMGDKGKAREVHLGDYLVNTINGMFGLLTSELWGGSHIWHGKGEYVTDAGRLRSPAPEQEGMADVEVDVEDEPVPAAIEDMPIPATIRGMPIPSTTDIKRMWAELSRPGGHGLEYRRFMTMWGGCKVCCKIMSIDTFLAHDCLAATRRAPDMPVTPSGAAGPQVFSSGMPITCSYPSAH